MLFFFFSKTSLFLKSIFLPLSLFPFLPYSFSLLFRAPKGFLSVPTIFYYWFNNLENEGSSLICSGDKVISIKTSSLDAAQVEWLHWGSMVFAALCVCHPLRMFPEYSTFFSVLLVLLYPFKQKLQYCTFSHQVLPAQLNKLCYFSLFLWSWLRDRP